MNKKNIGFWVLIITGILLNIVYLLGQTMAFISYDFAVMIGLQEPIEDITAIGVAANKGFGFGDTFTYMPLFIGGIIGLLKKKTWGYIVMAASLGITIYWPIVSMATLFFAKGSEGWHFNDYSSYAITLGLIAIYGCWGLAYLNKNKQYLMTEKSNINHEN